LSVLQKAFSRKDLSVVAIYIETCDGVPDHAAELRRQVAKHKIDYPVLDGEAGPIQDPTRKRFRGAPHALIVDPDGRVLHAYSHMPRMKTLGEDLTTLVATGLFPARRDDGWRRFRRGAWVQVRTEGTKAPRTETRILKGVSRDGVTIRRDGEQEKLFREPLDHTDTEFHRTERAPETVRVDGRDVKARVFEATWKRNDAPFEERSWTAQGVLLRRETVEARPDGVRIKRSYRLLKWNETYAHDAWKVDCRVAEIITTWPSGRTEAKVWTSESVPGHEVRRVTTTVSRGATTTETTTVVGFGLR